MPASNVLWPVPLQRLTPWYPGQFGVPGTDSDRGLRMDANGIVLWVDPNHVDANDGRDGTNPDSPLATVAAALTKVRAYRGDVIAVMHNSYWTYASTAAGRPLPIQETVAVDVPGVRIVGVSSSSLGVPWVPSANNQVIISVNAMDVVIEGFCFWDGAAGYTGCTGIALEWNAPSAYGENATVRHCNFYNLAYGVTLDYSWYCHIEDCHFESMSNAAIHNPSVYGEPDYNTLKNCVFISNVADVDLPDCDYWVIEDNNFLDATAAIAMLRGNHNKIGRNAIEADPTGTNNMINLTVAPGTSSNLVFDNFLSCTIAQYDVTCSDAGSGSWVNNHCVNGDTAANPV